MKIAIGTDHAAFELKQKVIEFLEGLGHQVDDCGPESDESVDYPDYASKVSRRIVANESDLGVLMCGSGIGMSMAANKFSGIRAALCHSKETAELARSHNDANVICLGARILDEQTILDCVKAFISTPFEGGRHERRVAKIAEIEKG